MRTQALFGLITVVLRAATLILQSLVIGGIVFQRWIAAGEPAVHKHSGVRLIRFSAVALALTQLLFLAFNTAVLSSSVGLGLADVATANFFVVGLITVIASLAIAATASRRLACPGNLTIVFSLAVLACGILASHAVSRIESRALLTTF